MLHLKCVITSLLIWTLIFTNLVFAQRPENTDLQKIVKEYNSKILNHEDLMVAIDSIDAGKGRELRSLIKSTSSENLLKTLPKMTYEKSAISLEDRGRIVFFRISSTADLGLDVTYKNKTIQIMKDQSVNEINARLRELLAHNRPSVSVVDLMISPAQAGLETVVVLTLGALYISMKLYGGSGPELIGDIRKKMWKSSADKIAEIKMNCSKMNESGMKISDVEVKKLKSNLAQLKEIEEKYSKYNFFKDDRNFPGAMSCIENSLAQQSGINNSQKGPKAKVDPDTTTVSPASNENR